MTVEAIRALNDKIENQSTEISMLKQDNATLKAQISKINDLEKMMVDLQAQLRAKTTANVTEETVATEK
jgi:cell division protein FtsB